MSCLRPVYLQEIFILQIFWLLFCLFKYRLFTRSYCSAFNSVHIHLHTSSWLASKLWLVNTQLKQGPSFGRTRSTSPPAARTEHFPKIVGMLYSMAILLILSRLRTLSVAAMMRSHPFRIFLASCTLLISEQ